MQNTTQTIAQLRHLYQNMVNGGVQNADSAKRIAESLLSPAIAALEAQAPAVPAVLPEIGSRWTHRNGTPYTVVMIANAETEDAGRYPVTVVYRDENGKVWSRAASDWHRSMTAAPEVHSGWQDNVVEKYKD
jgi:hypothetical protein